MTTFTEFLENHEPFDSMHADIPLPKEVYLLSKIFAKHNKTLFAVGGAIRDFLYHKYHDPKGKYNPKDVDLATDAQPQDINKILTSQEAQLNGIKVFPKGEAFGVISAIVNGQEYEIATFREEWYDPEKGDGRRPDQVTFSTPGKDAQRRDLTMNALFYDVDKKEIRDYNVDEAGRGLGLQDIRSLVARPVGNAKERFREDKLRIPRLIRFFSKYNPGEILDHLDQQTIAAIREFKDLAGVSPERIAAEFLAGLAKCHNTINYLKNYTVLDLYPAVFPGMRVDTQDIDRIGNIKNPKAILAWILKSNGDSRQIKSHLNGLKYPSDIFDRVEFLVRLFKFEPQKIALYLKQRDVPKQLKDPAMQSIAMSGLQQDVKDFAQIAGISDRMNHFMGYQSNVNSQDYMHLKGKEISDAIGNAEHDAYQKSWDQFNRSKGQ